MSSDDGQQAQPRGSLEFVESSILDTIIPSSTNLNIESLSGSVERLDEGSFSPLPSIAQRHTLFFGTLLAICEGLYILLIHSS
jgi:hypothetical protein